MIARPDPIMCNVSDPIMCVEGRTAEVLRSALQGVKVVDLCIVLAGPTCGRTMAEFGADVIKIGSPHRPLNRLYQASDGWLFLAARAGELAHCAELADLAGRSGVDLERAIEQRMRTRTVADWVERLNKAGIGAHRVMPSLLELMTDPITKARGLAITRDHEGFGPITTTAPGVKLSRTPMTVGRPAAKPGSDVASVLAEIGMGGELERLIREGVIAVDGVKAGC